MKGRGRVAIGLAIVAAVALLFLTARDAPIFATIEGQLLDWRFEARGPVAPGPEIVVLAIDDRTLDALGPWPLPRTVLAETVLALGRDGARVIAVDLLLGDAVRDGDGPDGTGELAAALSIIGKTALAFAFTTAADGHLPPLPEALAGSAYRIAHTPLADVPSALIRPTGFVASGPGLLAGSPAGHVNIVLDADGQLRYALPAIAYGEGDDAMYFPSLPVVAARLWRTLGPDALAVASGESVAIGDVTFPTDARMRQVVNFYGPAGSFAQYSVIDVLDGRLPPGAFRDKLVLIGAAATGIGDVFATPFSPVLPGVEYFATVVDNILHRRFLSRDDTTLALDLVILIVVGAGAAAIGALSRSAAIVAALAVLAVLFAVANYAAFAAGLWLNATFPMLALALLVIWNVAAHATHERRLRQDAETRGSRLARFVSPMAERAASGAAEPARELAVLFVDIRGFTGLAETMAPAEAMALLRAFHRRVEETVLRNRGVVDKFLGDGAMAVFGLDRPGPAAARDALVCAVELATGIGGLDRRRGDDSGPPLAIGIGLHFGPVEIGEVGGAQHADVTIGGDTVNVASRLEALTRAHGVGVIASDAVVEAVRAMGDTDTLAGFVALPEQEIRGRRSPLRIWAWSAGAGRPA